MLRAVIDTNVFISGLLKGSKAREIIKSFTNNEFQLVISDRLLDELIFTLQKPRLASLIPESDCALLIKLIRERTRFVNPTNKITSCRDSKDNAFLECALEANAIIVSGDEDLLTLSPFQGISIITLSKFLEKLAK